MRTFLRTLLALCAALACLAAAPGAMARNVALVIGNSSYIEGNALTNPVNDARLIANSARRAGFEVVERTDLTKASFERALRDFLQLANGAQVAMIYYAGHGIEAQGKNWLLPTDARLEADFDLPYEALDLDRLLEALSGAQVRMVVLDACRNNPFGKNWRRGYRSVPNGLAQFEADDFMVLYAAAPGQLATDGAGTNSPFALSLAQRLPEPGLAIQLLGGKVRDDVMRATGGAQRPFMSGSITGTEIYLVPAARPVAAPAPAPAAADSAATDALAWQGAVSADSAAAYQTYLRAFPNGLFAKLARDKVAAMSAAAAPVPVAAPVATPAPAPAPLARAAMPEPAVSAAPVPAPVAPPPEPTPALVEAAKPAPAPGPAQIPLPQPEVRPQPATAALALPLPETGTGLGGLPLLPPTPKFDTAGYPACREDYLQIPDGIARVEAINTCTSALDAYFQTRLTTYRATMAQHQEAISRLYQEKVGGTGKFEPRLQDQFYRDMMREHEASRPEGEHFAEWRAAEDRYRQDRAYLADRYCFMTGCNGYPGQTFYKDPPVPAKSGK